MREKITRFMTGRNGVDQFNMFLLVLDLVIIVLASVIQKTPGKILYPVSLALLAYIYFRMLSRNIYKRSDENNRYLRVRYKVLAELRVRKERWVQRKDYKFFICPACKTTLRVPRGHGRIKIVCRKCGNSFTGKS